MLDLSRSQCTFAELFDIVIHLSLELSNLLLIDFALFGLSLRWLLCCSPTRLFRLQWWFRLAWSIAFWRLHRSTIKLIFQVGLPQGQFVTVDNDSAAFRDLDVYIHRNV